MSTTSCSNCIKNYKHFCWDDHWARVKDDFLKNNKDYEDYISKQRFCSDWESDTNAEEEALYQAEEEHRVT